MLYTGHLISFFKNVTPLKEPYMKLLMSSLITWSGLPKEITQALESGCLKACSPAKGTCPEGENPPLSAYNRSYWTEATRRQQYNVHSPLDLWHIDENHKLIRLLQVNFKGNYRIGFRATINNQKFKVALTPPLHGF